MADDRDIPEPSPQQVFDRGTPAEQERYLELMRLDPIAGVAYLEGLALRQEARRRGA